jgi:hypothetical protein
MGGAATLVEALLGQLRISADGFGGVTMAKKTFCHNCKSYRRPVCWLIDKHFFCQPCAESTIELMGDATEHSIHRLSENDSDFEGGHRRKDSVLQPARIM